MPPPPARLTTAGKARHAAADKPADPIMQHTVQARGRHRTQQCWQARRCPACFADTASAAPCVQAKAPGLDAPHPPEPGAHEVKVPSLKTADGVGRPASWALPVSRAAVRCSCKGGDWPRSLMRSWT